MMNARPGSMVAGIGVAAIAGALASPVTAATDNLWDWNYDGFYLGAGVNGTSLDSSDTLNSAIDDIFDDEDLTASGDFSDFPVGGQVYVGWMLNRYLGIEGRWSQTADGEDTLTVTDEFDVQSRLDLEASMDGWTAYAVGNWPVAQRWDLYAKAGYTWQDLDFTASTTAGGGASFSDTGDDDGLAAALGARWRFARHWAATLEGEYMDLDFDDTLDEPLRGSLNVEYWFGGAEIPAAAPVAAAPVVAAAAPPPPPKAPMDSDGDGVPDGADQCPDTPPNTRVGPQGCTCDVTRQVHFATSSAELTSEDQAMLREVADTMTRLKFVSGTVVGHTDSTGSDAYNQPLSERRAESAVKFLESLGIERGRLKASGAGASQPIADNRTREGRALNRRVVLSRTDCEAPAN